MIRHKDKQISIEHLILGDFFFQLFDRCSVRQQSIH